MYVSVFTDTHSLFNKLQTLDGKAQGRMLFLETKMQTGQKKRPKQAQSENKVRMYKRQI